MGTEAEGDISLSVWNFIVGLMREVRPEPAVEPLTGQVLHVDWPPCSPASG